MDRNELTFGEGGYDVAVSKRALNAVVPDKQFNIFQFSASGESAADEPG